MTKSEFLDSIMPKTATGAFLDARAGTLTIYRKESIDYVDGYVWDSEKGLWAESDAMFRKRINGDTQ